MEPITEFLITGGIDFVTGLLAIVVGILTQPIWEYAQKLMGWLDRMPAVLKQVGVVAVAWGLLQLGALLQIALPTDLQLLETGHIEIALAAAAAMAIHAGKKKLGRTETET